MLLLICLFWLLLGLGVALVLGRAIRINRGEPWR